MTTAHATVAARGPATWRSQPALNIRFPEVDASVQQDEEWFEVELDGRWERRRIHDYDQIFSIEGLYESLVYHALECRSPKRVRDLLIETTNDAGLDPSDLRVIDLGAGNGIMGERLRDVGVERITGVDILPEAAMAAERDRPDVYEDYVVADLCELSDENRARLLASRPNVLSVVAALGFGDIPPRAFAEAFNLIETDGYVAFTLNEAFVRGSDRSGFARLIRAMLHTGVGEIEGYRRYFHRRAISGERIFYVVFIARKQRDIPADMLRTAEAGTSTGVSSSGDSPSSLLIERNGAS